MTFTPLQFSEFYATSKKEWIEGANAQLKTQNAEGELVWEIIPGWKIPAYFDMADTLETGYLEEYFSELRFDWHLTKSIQVIDVPKANLEALKSLNQGCTCILFKCKTKVDYVKLTSNIQFQHCFVSFAVDKSEWLDVSKFMSLKQVNGFCHSNDGMILGSNASATEMALQLTKYAKSPSLTNLYVNAGRNFFFEIARLRAFRYLINRMSVLLGSSDVNFWIHSEIEVSSTESENLLVQTSAGLAAVIGGANSVAFSSEDEGGRIATNVGNLIREEAKIYQFNDASSGSYFIDYITDQLIKQVWAQFQEMQS